VRRLAAVPALADTRPLGGIGSDLRDLAIAAAYQPIREHLAAHGDTIAREATGPCRAVLGLLLLALTGGAAGTHAPLTLRPLVFADFERAVEEVHTLFLSVYCS
jgi:hypothetical protein